MAEYVQTMKDIRRMCDAYASNCYECPLTSYECACTPKHRLFFTDKQVEEIVATWAAVHPEPVYPTWIEWLHDNGIVLDARQHDEIEHSVLGLEAINPIPADIAQKLGIEPKKG